MSLRTALHLSRRTAADASERHGHTSASLALSRALNRATTPSAREELYYLQRRV